MANAVGSYGRGSQRTLERLGDIFPRPAGLSAAEVARIQGQKREKRWRRKAVERRLETVEAQARAAGVKVPVQKGVMVDGFRKTFGAQERKTRRIAALEKALGVKGREVAAGGKEEKVQEQKLREQRAFKKQIEAERRVEERGVAREERIKKAGIEREERVGKRVEKKAVRGERRRRKITREERLKDKISAMEHQVSLLNLELPVYYRAAVAPERETEAQLQSKLGIVTGLVAAEKAKREKAKKEAKKRPLGMAAGADVTGTRTMASIIKSEKDIRQMHKDELAGKPYMKNIDVKWIENHWKKAM